MAHYFRGQGGLKSTGSVMCALLLLLSVAAGCREKPEEPPPAMKAVVTEENADLIIALLPERNVFEQKRKYLPLQEYLSDKLGQTVYFKLLDNYGLIFSELLDDKIDGGFWGSMNGTIAQIRGGVEMLARPVWPDGSSTYWGYVFTRKGSGITADPRSWSGRSIAFVNQATTAGFLYPLSVLREAGIDDDPADFFSRAVFSGSHDASIQAVYQGEMDMGACKNWIFQEFVSQYPDVAEKLVVLSESLPVPSNGLGVRPNLDENLKESLKAALISMDELPEGRTALEKFGALRFIETSVSDYQPVIDMADKAGINLTEWPLRDVRGARPYR
jgi:phosphonate transport system substrate-binding protein